MKFVGKCIECGKILNGITQQRFIKNPNRRCVDCYKKNVTGRHSHGDGYMYVKLEPGRKGKRKYEHRIIMEQILGRSLNNKEVVHHINGDPSDNRPENLQFYSNPGEHVLKAGHVIKGKDGKFMANPSMEKL